MKHIHVRSRGVILAATRLLFGCDNALDASEEPTTPMSDGVAMQENVSNASGETVEAELMAAGGYFQGLKAAELIDELASETRPKILVGDLNMDAPSGDVYKALENAGFAEVWNLIPVGRGDGYTCCQDPDLANPVPALNRRIDLVLIRNFDPAFRHGRNVPAVARIAGGHRWERTAPGLWPSDHAGVQAWMLLPRWI